MSENFQQSACQDFAMSPCQNRRASSISYKNQTTLNGVDLSGSTTYPTGRPYATLYDACAADWTRIVNPTTQYNSFKAPLFAVAPSWGTIVNNLYFNWPTPVAKFDTAISGFIAINPFLAPGELQLFLGMAKNVTQSALTYSIVRFRLGNSPVSLYPWFLTPGTLVSGVPTTIAQVDIIASSASLPPGRVIGYGQYVDLPFPAESAFDLAKVGNNQIISDLYFAKLSATPNELIQYLTDNLGLGPWFPVGTTSENTP
jgi:hypothetical protein